METAILAKLYIEIDVIFVIILCCLLYSTIRSSFIEQQRIAFSYVLITNILFVLSDLVWVFNNRFISYMVLGSNWKALGYVMNGFNEIMGSVAGVFWLNFSEGVQGRWIFTDKKKTIQYCIPVLLLAALIMSTPLTDIMFYITDDGRFVRQSGYAVQTIISFSYIVAGVALALKSAAAAKNNQERKRSVTMARFAIAPTIFITMQMFIHNMSVFFIGTIVALVNVYMSLQDQLVVYDPLTKLNNRTMLDQKVTAQIQSLDAFHELWLMMIDADKFKSINDNYGHQEGDHALMLIADALRRSCADTRDFICRYGGDEFIILHRAGIGDGCEKLAENINKLLSEHELPYKLSVSVGAAKYAEGINDWSQLLKLADEELYKVKNLKKGIR